MSGVAILSVEYICVVYRNVYGLKIYLWTKIYIYLSTKNRDVYIEGTGFLSILSISLPTRKSGIRQDKYLSAAIFKKAVHSDDP